MSMNMSKLQKARARMLIKHPFFATLLMSTTAVEVSEDWWRANVGDGAVTAATDMDKFYYNAEFIDSLDDDVVLFVLAHEVMHIALAHGMRLMKRNHKLWNIACDYAINLVLRDSGFVLWDQCLVDDQYKDMSADQIYEKLQQQCDAAKKAGGSGDPTEMFGDGGGMIGDLMPPEGAGDPAAEARTQRSIQQRVAQAVNVARMAGKLSGSLERLVGEILDPKVPWAHVLRDYMTRVTKDDETWSRRNRRFRHVYLPARHSERMGDIVLIGDTSGSISADEMTRYMTEASSIAEDVRPERIVIIWVDAKVKGTQIFEQGELIVPKPKGGGGTDMVVGLKEAEKYEPEVVVLFTDGLTPWPDREPDFPVIVCCTSPDSVPVPIGMDIRI